MSEMIDVKSTVEDLLGESAALVAILGAKYIYTDHTKNKEQWPRIVLFDVSLPDTDYADDMPTAYEPTIQVSIFSKEETLAIFNVVDSTMKAAGWRRTTGHEMYEADEQVYHRPCRYKTKFMYS